MPSHRDSSRLEVTFSAEAVGEDLVMEEALGGERVGLSGRGGGMRRGLTDGDLRMEFEQLEPRILLSASDPVAAALPDPDREGLSQVVVEAGADELLNGVGFGESEFIYDADDDEGLFEGVEQEGVADSESEEEALGHEEGEVHGAAPMGASDGVVARADFTDEIAPGEPEFSESSTVLMIETLRAPNGPPALTAEALAGAGKAVILDEGDLLAGEGELLAPLVNEAGAVRPGGTTGLLTVASFVQEQDASLQVKVGGAATSRLVVAGDVELGGQLRILPAEGYEAQVGDRFTVLTWGGERTGEFAYFLGTAGIGEGLYFEPHYEAGALVLEVVHNTDVLADEQTALLNIFQQLSDVSEALESFESLNAALPVIEDALVGASSVADRIGDLLDMSQTVLDVLRSPLDGIFDEAVGTARSLVTTTLQNLASTVTSYLVSVTGVTLHEPSAGVFYWDLNLSAGRDFDATLDPGSGAALGATFSGSSDLTGTASLGLDLRFGYDPALGGAFVTLNEFEAGIEINATSLNFSVDLTEPAATSLGVTDGEVALSAAVAVTPRAGVLNGGTLTLATVESIATGGVSLGSAFELSATGTVDATLPLSGSVSAAGFSLSGTMTARLQSEDLFAGDIDLTVETTGFGLGAQAGFSGDNFSGTFGVHTADGETHVTANITNFRIEAGATRILEGSGSGTFLIDGEDSAGVVELTISAGPDIPDTSLDGTFSLKFNTGSSEVTTIGETTVDLPAGPYLRIEGEGTLTLSGSPAVTLGGQFVFEEKTAADSSTVTWFAVSDPTVTLGTGSETLLSATGGSAAFIFDSSTPGFAGTASGLTVTLSVPGVTSLTGTFGLQVNTTGAAVNKTVTVGGSPITVNMPDGDYFRVDGTGVALELTLSGAAYTLSGNFSFEQREVSGATKLTVGVTDLATSFVDGSSNTLLDVSGGTGLFVMDDEGVAASVTASIDLLPSVSAVSAAGTFLVQINTYEEAVDESVTIGSDTVDLDLPAGPYLRVAGSGVSLSMTVGGSTYSVTGNFSFEKSGTGEDQAVKVGASEVGTTIPGPGSVELTASGGSGALLVNSAGVAGEISVPTVELTGAGSLTLTASNLVIAFNTTGAAVPSTEIITSSDPSSTYTIEFDEPYYYTYFAISGAAALNTSFAALQGNFAFEKATLDIDDDGTDEEVIKVGASGVNFSLRAGSRDIVSFHNGSGAFLITDDGVAGTADLEFDTGLVGISGDIGLIVNTTGEAIDTSVPTGNGDVPVDLAAGNYLEVDVDGRINLGSTSLNAVFTVEVDLAEDEIVLRPDGGGDPLVTIDSDGNIDLGDGLNFDVFANPTPESILALLKSLTNWLSVFKTSEVFETEIPFTDTTIGEAIDWSSGFIDQLYSHLVTYRIQSGNDLDFSGGTAELPSGTFELMVGDTEITVDTSSVTGLWNQTEFQDRLQSAIDSAVSTAGLSGDWVNVDFVDIDGAEAGGDFLVFDLARERLSETTQLVMQTAGIFSGDTFRMTDAMAAVESALDATVSDLVDRIGVLINDMRVAAGRDPITVPSYDPLAQMIVWPMVFDYTYSKTLDLSFSEDIGPIGGVSLDGQIELSAEVGLEFTLGLDWGASEVPRLISNAFTPAPTTGVITEDAEFTLILNDSASATFDFSGANALQRSVTTGNSSLEDLAADLNQAFRNFTWDADGDGSAENLGDLIVAQKAGSGLAISVCEEEDRDGDGVLDTVNEDDNGNGELDPGEDSNGNGLLDYDEDLNDNGQFDNWLGVVNQIVSISDKESIFATELGFGAEGCDPDGTANPDGSHWKTTSVVGRKGLFIDGVTQGEGPRVYANLTLDTPQAVDGTLRLGFVDLTIGNDIHTDDVGAIFRSGTPEGAEPIGLDLSIRDQSTGGTRFYLADLFTNSDSESLSNITPDFDFTGGFYAEINDITVGIGGTGFDISLFDLLGPDAKVSIFIPDLTEWEYNPDPYDEEDNNEGIFLTYPDLDNLLDFEDFGFADIVRALRTLIDMLDGLQAFEFLDKEIPFVNASVNDLLDYVGQVANLIEAVGSSPTESIQGLITQLEDEIENLFDLSEDALGVVMDGAGVIRFDLDFQAGYANSLPLQLSLDDLVGYISDDSGGFASFLEGATDFISLGGSGNLTVNATANLSLDFGIDISDEDEGARLFLYDSTGIVLTAKVLGTDLSFDAGLGSMFGIYVRDGTVTLDGDGDPDTEEPATFTLGLREDSEDHRYYFGEDNFFSFDNIELDLEGGASAVLPVFFPNDSTPLGDEEDGNDDGYPDNQLVIDIPDLVRLFVADKTSDTDLDLEFRGDDNDLDVTGPSGGYEVELRNNDNLDGGANASWNSGDRTLTVSIQSGVTPASEVVSAISAVSGFSAAMKSGNDGTGKVAKIIIAAPDFSAAFEDLSLCELINSYVDEFLDGFDYLLGQVQNALSSVALSQNLPMVGSSLGDAVRFIDDFRTGIVQELRDQIRAAGGALDLLADYIKLAIWETLGPGGINLLANPEDGSDFDPDLGHGQIDVTIDCEDGLYVDLLLSKSLALLDTSSNPIDFDIGVDGFGLAVSGNVILEIGFDLKLRFGISMEDGFYISTGGGLDWTDENGNGEQDEDEGGEGDSGDPEIAVEFSATIPGLQATGELFFLQLDVADGHDGEDGSFFGGFFYIDLMDPNEDGKLTWAEITSSGLQFDDVIEYELGARAEVNLDLAVSFGGDASFPRLVGEFDLDWEWIAGEESEGPILGFNNFALDVGSFISDFLAPVVEEIRKVTEPLDPIIDLVQARLPVLSDLAGETITLLTLADAFGLLEPSTLRFIEAVIKVVDIINNLPTEEGELLIPIGSFQLGEDENGERNQIELREELGEVDLAEEIANTSGSSSTSPSFREQAGNFIDSVGDLDNFSFPFIDNPVELLGLLIGNDVTLVRWDLPKFKFEFSYTQSLPIYPPLYVHFGGKIGAIIDIGFGYDTYGLRQFITSGDWNPVDLFEGFFVADYDANGNERAELILYGEIFAGASLDLGIAEFGVTGGVYATIEFDLNDPNEDGKVRISELVSNALLDPRCIFDIHGEIGLFLEAFLRIDLFFISIDKTWRFAEITLFSFDITCPEPILASVNDSTGELLVHIGPEAEHRENIDTNDGEDHIIVSHVSGDPTDPVGETVTVQWKDYTQEYSGVKSVQVDGGEQDDTINLTGVLATIISVKGGAGNDTIILGEGGGDGSSVTVEGGDGDDVITAGSGGGLVIDGGNGNDTLTAGSAAIELRGGAGADTLLGSVHSDILSGGDGEDTITAYAGDDTIDGGAGNDWITGNDDNDTITGGEGDDTLYGKDGEDFIDGGGGADLLVGGLMDDRLVGGPGDDRIYGQSGDDVLVGDDGTIDADIPEVTAISGEGHDMLVGGGGKDILFGGDGDDELFGGTLFLDGETEVFQEDDNDFLDGGRGTDREFGDDAYGTTTTRDTGMSVVGRVWFDVGFDGIQDEDETGLAGVTVILLQDIASKPVLGTAVTKSDGSFTFLGLKNTKTYYLEFEAPSGYLFSPQDAGSDDSVDSDADQTTGETASFTLDLGERNGDLAAGMTSADPTLTIEEASLDEGDSASSSMEFVLTLSRSFTEVVTVDYETVALAGGATPSIILESRSGLSGKLDLRRVTTGDYDPVVGTVQFGPGETSKTISVPINGDRVFEDVSHEEFELELSNLDNATFAYGSTALGMIVEDDEAPSISVGDYQPDQFDEDQWVEDSTARFTVSLSGEADETISVSWTTRTSTEGDGDVCPMAADVGSDYDLSFGVVNFAPGETEKEVTVNLMGDDLDEDNETFFVVIHTPVGPATLGDDTGVGIIPDDDDPVQIRIHVPGDTADHIVAVDEGHAGYTEVTFRVSLVDPASTLNSHKSGKTVTVDFSDGRGTAVPEYSDDPSDAQRYGDYEPTSTADSTEDGDDSATTLTFLPGEDFKELTVRVKGDLFSEGQEEFFVNLFGAQNADMANNHAVVVINDDDPVSGVDYGGLEVALATTDLRVQEEDGVARVKLIRALSAEACAVVLSVHNGSAYEGSDYTADPRQLILFEDGETVKYVEIPLIDDSEYEDDEVFYLELRALTGAPLGWGTVTITEAEDAPSFRVDNPGLTDEGGTVTFTITMHLPSGTDSIQDNVTLTVATEDITATSGSDYTVPGFPWATFLAGAVDGDTLGYLVDTNPDGIPEPVEEFALRITDTTAGTITDGYGIAGIKDDDPVTLTGTVFHDANGNGFMNLSEGGLEDISITLTDTYGDTVGPVTTDEFGNFQAAVVLGPVALVVDQTSELDGFTLTTGNDNQTGDWDGGGLSPFARIGYQAVEVEGFPEDADDAGSGFTHDTIFGGPGNDEIDAGGGDDLVVGGHWMSATNANVPINQGSYEAELYRTEFLGTEFWQVHTGALDAASGTVMSLVWSDTGTVGLQDGGEAGVPDVTVHLKDDQGNTVQSVLTDATGLATFELVYPGSYLLEVENPEGSAFTSLDVGGDDTIDSDINSASRQTAVFTVSSGSTVKDWDAGLVADSASGSAAGGLGFSETSYSVVEDDPAGEALITVTRSGSMEPLALVYETTPGTAIAGVHYDSVRGVVLFDVGDTEKSFTVPIHDTDMPIGESRTVLLSLRVLTGQPVRGESILYIVGANNNFIEDDDLIWGGGDDDYLLGDSGTITPDGLSIVDAGGAGMDEIEGNDGDDYLDGQLGDDILNANEGENQDIKGGFGDDQIGADIDDQTLDGGPGTDTVISTWDGHFALQTSKLDLLDRDDGSVFTTFTLVSVEVAKLTGGYHDNRFILTGWTGEAYLDGQSGEDAVEVENNLDMILTDSSLSSSEADLFKATHGFEKEAALALSNGSTYHLGGVESATLTGGSGANLIDVSGFGSGATLQGMGGDDTLIGGPGDDFFLFDADSALGSDSVTGGGGTDTVDLSATSLAVLVDLSAVGTATAANGNLALTFPSEDIEIVIGGDGGDTLTGNSLANTLVGGPGDDGLAGAGGNDYYGYDTDLPWGSDTITEYVGEGYDTIDFSDTNTLAVAFDLSLAGTQVVNAHLALTVGGDGEFETLIGGDQNDTLSGNGFDNDLHGGPGNDELFGGGGGDLLDGGTGDDYLDGGSGSDTVAETADTDFTLGGGKMEWDGQTDDLVSIEAVELTGGASPNHFHIEGWNGNVGINGLSGPDHLLIEDDADFTATDGSVISSSGGTYLYGGIERLVLTGGGGANLLDASAVTSASGLVVVQLEGWGGSDTLVGSELNDVLLGGAGNDSLEGGLGNDVIDGGEDNDILTEVRDVDFIASAGLILIGSELDTITNIENAHLIGGGSDNVFEVGGWSGGDLTIDGGGGVFDYVRANADADFTLTDSALEISGSSGTINLVGLAVVWLTGGDSDNILDASAFTGTCQLDGLAGNDRLIAGRGDDFLLGGEGDDLYLFDLNAPSGSDFVIDSGGIDTLDFSATTAVGVTVDLSQSILQSVNANLDLTINTGDSVENVIGTDLVDTLIGNSLDNQLTGAGSADTLDGGAAGTDRVIEMVDDDMKLVPGTLTIGTVDDTLLNIDEARLTGGAGPNILDASAWTLGPVELSGEDGMDRLLGGSGNDVLTGGPGDDTLEGGDGDDTYRFDADEALGTDEVIESVGAGRDTLDFSGTELLGVTVNLANTSQVVNGNHALEISAGDVIENLIGGRGDDVLLGNDLHNQLTGGEGLDTIKGGGGTNVLIESHDADMVLSDLGGNALLVIDGVEEVVSGISGALLSGGAGANLLDASAFSLGPVQLDGGAGNDTLFGGSGDDFLMGGAGHDWISGGAGTDQITGGTGNDDLFGGDGTDLYYFDMGSFLGVDTVTEFSNGGAGGNADSLIGPGAAVDLSSTDPQVIIPDIFILILTQTEVEFSFL